MFWDKRQHNREKEEMMMPSKRIEYIDAIKGFAAICVIIGHVCDGYLQSGLFGNVGFLFVLFKLIYSFHMALFFILSGFLMEHTYRKIIDGLSFPQFIGRRLKSLYAPYLCAECVGIFVVFIVVILFYLLYLNQVPLNFRFFFYQL